VISTKNGNKIRCILGDETGTVKAFLSDHNELANGRTIALFGAEARVVAEHIEIQLGKVRPARSPIKKVNESVNISQKAWVPAADND
jgi:hypothetical protein